MYSTVCKTMPEISFSTIKRDVFTLQGQSSILPPAVCFKCGDLLQLFYSICFKKKKKLQIVVISMVFLYLCYYSFILISLIVLKY